MMRAQVAAMHALFSLFFGMAMSPVLAGFFNDHLFPGPEGVRYSLMSMVVLCGVLGVSRQPSQDPEGS